MNELLLNLHKLHITALGEFRLQRNLLLETENIVEWCKAKINSSNTVITRNGKNWYAEADDCIITVNATSFTIITAHKKKDL